MGTGTDDDAGASSLGTSGVGLRATLRAPDIELWFPLKPVPGARKRVPQSMCSAGPFYMLSAGCDPVLREIT